MFQGKAFFERHLFFLTGFAITIRVIYATFIEEFSHLNRTIGWAWDLFPFFWRNSFNLALLYLIAYGVLYFLKRETLFFTSLLHFILMIFLWWPVGREEYSSLFIFLNLLAILVFIFNLVTSKKIVEQK